MGKLSEYYKVIRDFRIKNLWAILFVRNVSLFCFLIFSWLSCQDKESFSKTPKKLVVSMNVAVPPLQAIDKDGKPYGIFVDLVRDLASDLGRELEIVFPGSGSSIPGLKTGEYDLISFLVITPERQKVIDFSIPCGRISVSFIVKKGFPFVENFEQLNNPKVRLAVLKGSYPESIAFKQFPNANIVSLPDLDSSVLEVVQGKSDVAFLPTIMAHKISKKYPGQVQVYYQSLSVRDVSLGVRKTKDKKFLKEINVSLSDYLESGRMRFLGDKYLGDLKEEFAKRGLPWNFVF